MLKRPFLLFVRPCYRFSRKKVQEEAETAGFTRRIEKYDPFFTSSSLLTINKYKVFGVLMALGGGWVVLHGARMVEFGEEEVRRVDGKDGSGREEERIVGDRRKKIRLVQFKNGK